METSTWETPWILYDDYWSTNLETSTFCPVEVVNAFDEYFQIRVNVIMERAKFNRRYQKEDENADEFIAALYNLVETCNYGNLKEEMLRDRLVVGIRDATLSEKLQMNPDLTLEIAKREIRLKEAVQSQQKELQGDTPAAMQAMMSKKWPRRSGACGKKEEQSQKKGYQYKPRLSPQCSRCGNARHPLEKCPAKGVVCNNCGKRGHFGKHCFSKKKAKSAGELSLDTSSLDTAFLGNLSMANESSWSADVEIKREAIHFKLDTGAEVTAISEKSFQSLSQVSLKKATKVVYGPARQKLDVMGQFEEVITYGDNSSKQTIFVIRNLKVNMLGFPANTALNILKRADAVVIEEKTIKQQFSKVFSGLGDQGEEYHIQLKEGAHPYCLYTPRNVPIPLKEKVQVELDKMEKMGVISKVNKPTDWCAGMVIVPKKSGEVRICVDLKALNDNVLREVHPIPKVDETLAQLVGAKIFSKLDANSGFWQIPLADDSRLLTTFVTPNGRYCFNKLPFGITSAPELFQKRMQRILERLQGVLCHIDDVLIFGASKEDHDRNLQAVLKRLEAAGTTLNPTKCEFHKSSIKFLGHVIDKDGIRADPSKLQAIIQMEAPQSVTELRRFMGMVNQLGKFSRELLSSKNTWRWGPHQDRAFSNVKEEITRPTVLAHYNPNARTKISADASSFGMGSILLQLNNDVWKPVAYASHSLTETERRYAQIEKEALAVTWSCEKFRDYILGKRIDIETDHKSLVPILSSKRLDALPPRVLRFRLRLDKYDFQIQHVPGKLIYVADTLSRAPLPETDGREVAEHQEEVEVFIAHVTRCIQSEQQSLDVLRQKQAEDDVCTKVMENCKSNWPRKHLIEPQMIPCWKLRSSLTLHDNLLLFNDRIVIPTSMRKDML